MRAGGGGKRPGERKPPRAPGARPSRPSRPAPLPEVARSFDEGFPLGRPRPFRPVPEHRAESAAGLRHEITDLRAEVKRLAAEIDKLWARERGRGAATPARTARSIAGKPVRTGTRASRPGQRPGAAGPARPGATRSGPRKGAAPAGAGTGASKRSTGAKRSSGWAKPKTRSRRSGTTPRRKPR